MVQVAGSRWFGECRSVSRVSFTAFLSVVFALMVLDRMALSGFRIGPLVLGARLLTDTLRQSTDAQGAHLVNCLG